mmetsp:Transcript_30669/g.54836  ORF Transcript_30669/g.54836 Transcript_30669/m.54836 type:complete len:123 (+) Transcript_30669:121-489(+)|eukprot:CAMPEP_0115049240 /NCGR_PEP_ID=MMETSP0227-20121206/1071_1 /TAXON_ID=89957 /ORGANISM="Polarella glacialis, Strain CCMP 1383" /LENGTH=122 /DNA_ID=CAMNT_0002432867 /DNA_START=227 /DNA_END=595 /DNA_ORIENTATION=-
MAEDVKMKLVFVNDNATAELVVAMTTRVADLKTRIIQDFWPATLPAVDTVDRLRLFAGGREIGGKEEGADAKDLKDAKLAVSVSTATPVHVVPVLKTGGGTTATTKEGTTGGESSQCFCTLL